MLLSFSVDYMLPYIVMGLRQMNGIDVGDARVKRQTIRARGMRAEALLAEKDPAKRMTLDLWWKSRTPAKAFIGTVQKWTIEPLLIENYRGALYVATPKFPKLNRLQLNKLYYNDGFPDLFAFRDYFAPDHRDKFNGVIYRW